MKLYHLIGAAFLSVVPLAHAQTVKLNPNTLYQSGTTPQTLPTLGQTYTNAWAGSGFGFSTAPTPAQVGAAMTLPQIGGVALPSQLPAATTSALGAVQYGTTAGTAAQGNTVLPLTGGTMSGALSNNVSIASRLYLNNGNLIQSGSTLTRYLNFTNSTGGWYSGSADGLFRVNLSDYASAPARINGLQFDDTLGNSSSGNRYIIQGYVGNNSPPAVSATSDVALFGNANPTQPSGVYNPNNIDQYNGSWWGGDSLVNPGFSAENWYGMYSWEFDTAIVPNARPAVSSGVYVENQGSSGGIFTNNAVQISGNPYWKYGIEIGAETNDWPLLTDGSSTIIGTVRREYDRAGGTTNPSAGWGLNFQNVAFSHYSVAVPGMSVDPTGNMASTSITTNSFVQAATAAVSGVTINSPGLYSAIPTFTVQSPPAGGTTATATVATMVGVQLLTGFNSTGSGVSVGATCTYPVGTNGSTGTSPTLVAASVDANGGVTSWTIPSVGSSNEGATSTPPTPGTPINLICSSGSGVQVALKFAQDQTNDIYMVSQVTDTATGSGYPVGGVITPTGDTGTEPTFTVSAVTATGGITAATLTTPGSVTAVSAQPATGPNTTGGSGTGASVNVGWGLGSFTTTPGSGYLAGSPPQLFINNGSSQSAVQAMRADLTATMAASPAPLVLNPSGGDVAIGPVGPRSALSTTATSGYIDLPYMSGTPTGSPGNAPASCVVNVSAGALNCFYAAAWHHITFSAGAQ